MSNNTTEQKESIVEAKNTIEIDLTQVVQIEDGKTIIDRLKNTGIMFSNKDLDQCIKTVKIKRLNKDSIIPTYAKTGDAGMDLTAVTKGKDEMGNIVYGTGLAFEIPEGHVGLLFPRSSNSKTDLSLTNSVGVIDSGYRGEVTFKFSAVNRINVYMSPEGFKSYDIGDRIGQIIIMPYPQVKFVEVEELSETDRGTGGYGSTGK